MEDGVLTKCGCGVRKEEEEERKELGEEGWFCLPLRTLDVNNGREGNETTGSEGKRRDTKGSEGIRREAKGYDMMT